MFASPPGHLFSLTRCGSMPGRGSPTAPPPTCLKAIGRSWEDYRELRFRGMLFRRPLRPGTSTSRIPCRAPLTLLSATLTSRPSSWSNYGLFPGTRTGSRPGVRDCVDVPPLWLDAPGSRVLPRPVRAPVRALTLAPDRGCVRRTSRSTLECPKALNDPSTHLPAESLRLVLRTPPLSVSPHSSAALNQMRPRGPTVAVIKACVW